MGIVTKVIDIIQQKKQTAMQEAAADIQTKSTIATLQEQIRQVQEGAIRQEELYTRQAEAAIGKGTAAFGASGVSLAGGSAMQVLESARETATADIDYLREQSAAQVEALQQQIEFAKQGGEIQIEAVQMAGRAAAFGTIASIVTEPIQAAFGGGGFWG